MEPRISIITLPVDDLERSLVFYRDGLGLPTDGIADIAYGGSHILFQMQGDLSLVLFQRAALAAVTKQIGDGRGAAACILSYAAASKEEADTVIRRAEAAGATVAVPPEAQPWGYSGYFKDPDGHLWEVVTFQADMGTDSEETTDR